MVKTVALSLEAGQVVWFQSSLSYIPSESVKVTSVGRLWAHLDSGFRCNRYTGEVDGGAYVSPGTVYVSRAEYDKEQVLYQMWRRLQKDMLAKRFLREDVSRRDLLQVRRLLRLDE